MAFSNLEQKYKQTVNKLYKGDRTKFDNGKPSTGLNDDPLITRRRGDGYFGGASRAFGRALPITSSFQDLKRITLFTLSVRGITFLVKQQLLQTGNTFEQTRLINPAFAIGNAVPFLHLRRHLRPFNTLLKRTDTSYSNVKKLGQLQKSTYEGASTDNKKGLGGLVKRLTAPITSTISAVTAKKNVGEELSWEYSRPELGKKENDYINSLFNAKASFKFGGVLNPDNDTFTFTTNIRYGSISRKAGAWDGSYTTYLSYMDGEKRWTFRQTGGTDYEYSAVTRPDRGLENIPDDDGEAFALEARSYNLSETAAENDLLTKYTSEDSVIQTQLFENQKKYLEAESAWLQEMTTSEEENIPFLKYFDSDTESITGQRTVNDNTGEVFSQNAKYFARNRTTEKRISYIKDPANETVTSTRDILRPYRTINNDFDDAINVSIAMGNDQPLKFRAFIKDLQQSASPQYKDYQYIGRTEKFISYVTVQREIGFKLGVLAFSKDELSEVWKRINYLTALVYPYGVNRGILQPNIMRLTIGNIYVNQPGYLTSLSTNFTEMSESWDIDREVPIGAQMDMKFVLIEKNSRIASSPLYGITEQMSGSGGFAQSIQSR